MNKIENFINSHDHLQDEGYSPLERRVYTPDRRQYKERRSQEERRFDTRLEPIKLQKKIQLWFNSLTHPRLGIDRRKKNDRRKNFDRRHKRLEPLLTPEEIADLFS